MPRALTRRRVGAGLALLAAVAVVLVVVLSNSSTSSGSTNNSAVSNSPGTTTVQRRDLVETDTESGTLSYARAATVYNRLSGTITWLPGVGQLIKPGETLYKIDGVPVMLMNGTTPAYRDLSAADTPGPDVLELNRNLIALGFNPDGIVADDTWQAATTAGVDVLQAYLKQTETGVLTLGQVVFLPGPQLVSSLSETLGADPSGSTSAASLSTATFPAGRPEFVSLQNGTTSTPRSTGPGSGPPHNRAHGCQGGEGGSRARQKCSSTAQSLRALIALLEAEVAELKAQKSTGSGSANSSSGNHSGSKAGHSGSSGNPSGASGSPSGSSPSGSGSPSGGGGGGSGGATAVLQTTSTRLAVTVDLDASKQSEAKVGERVTVEMPAGNLVGGTVSAVSSVAQSSSGNSGGGGSPGGGGSSGGSGGSSSTIPVTITLNRTPRGAGLDQAAVSVNFAQAEAKNVLSVPVTALVAVPGGGYAVQEAAAPHRLIHVTTGLFAAGYVQISGPGIEQGLHVTNSEG